MVWEVMRVKSQFARDAGVIPKASLKIRRSDAFGPVLMRFERPPSRDVPVEATINRTSSSTSRGKMPGMFFAWHVFCFFW